MYTMPVGRSLILHRPIWLLQKGSNTNNWAFAYYKAKYITLNRVGVPQYWPNTPPAAGGVLGHAHRRRWGRWSIRLLNSASAECVKLCNTAEK